jgi:glycosyltransferase involved in cell wall biosynthesis
MGGARPIRVAMLLGKSDEHDTRVFKEAETLAAAGHDVRVISLADWELPPFETLRGVEYERVGLSEAAREAWQRRRDGQEARLDGQRRRASRLPRGVVVAARSVYRSRLRLEREIYLWVRAARWHQEYWTTVAEPLARFDPDVVHAHDLLTLYAGRRHARLRGVPLVYDSHEFERGSRRYPGVRNQTVVRAVERLGIRAASAVVTVSPAIAEELSRIYRIPCPQVLLNSPPLDESLAPAPFSLREVCGVGPEETLVVFTGALSGARGIEETVDAFAELPQSFHLALMGPRKPHREAMFRERAAALGLEGRVHLVDAVRGDQVGAVIASADAAVVPQGKAGRSQDLTLPNKLFDAVLAGLPVAAAATTSVAAFVRRHEVGALFDVDDPPSIAPAIREVVERTPPGIADVERLRRLQEEVCWERQSETLLELYARLGA